MKHIIHLHGLNNFATGVDSPNAGRGEFAGELKNERTYDNYSVSQKNGYARCWQIPRLPRSLEIPSWTFFNSPFRIDFKNVIIYIIWCNLDRDIGKILQGHHFQAIFFP